MNAINRNDNVKLGAKSLSREAGYDAVDHTPSQWRKRPVVVDAMQHDERDAESIARILAWAGGRVVLKRTAAEGRPCLYVRTFDGIEFVGRHDWIIRDPEGEFSRCTSSIFVATYEPATRTEPPGAWSLDRARAAVSRATGNADAITKAGDSAPTESAQRINGRR